MKPLPKQMKELLKAHWGYQSFLPLQEETILSILAGRDTLTMLATGGGKSLCFQLPALLKDGLAVVISPLIGLMKDQIDALRQRFDVEVVRSVSGLTGHDAMAALGACLDARIVDEDGPGHHFHHDIARDVVYRSIGIERRRAVALGEDAPLVDAVGADVVLDLLGALLDGLAEAREDLLGDEVHLLDTEAGFQQYLQVAGESRGIAGYIRKARERQFRERGGCARPFRRLRGSQPAARFRNRERA